MTRREFMVAGIGLVAFRDETLDVVANLVAKTTPTAQDEDFWSQIQQAFALDRNIVNLNNGGCSPSPRIVQDALRRQIEYANQAPSYFMWRHLEPEIESVRIRLAKTFGVDTEEIAITRNASESLETCLLGIDLRAGDEILTTDLDYPRMIATIKQRERREGVKMVTAPMPAVPQRHSELVRPIEERITARTKMILISHVSFLNGQIFPVKAICELGASRGIPVIVDGAHAFAQFPFKHSDLACEYYGVSLHKWLMAPVGTGLLYVKRERIGGVWPLMAANEPQKDDVRKFEEIGTHPAANHNAIGEALTFHEMIGAERKADRFRYLRSIWTEPLRAERNVRFSTNLAPEHSCALTTVEIAGIPPVELADWLFKKHHIFVTTIDTPPVRGIRVTPNVYTTRQEIERFRDAMLAAARNGIAG